MKIIATVLLALALTVGASTLASAQSSIGGYNEQGGQIQSQVDTGAGTDGSGVAGSTQSTDGGGSLPFTGLDLALLALAGGALVAVGVGMRRLTRSPESA